MLISQLERRLEKVNEESGTCVQPAQRLPSGNSFVKDPAKRFPRPDGNPGGDIAYVQNNFDDSGWRKLNLPHDWAIEGPFNSGVGGVGGGMGVAVAWTELVLSPMEFVAETT